MIIHVSRVLILLIKKQIFLEKNHEYLLFYIFYIIHNIEPGTELFFQEATL